MSKPKGSRRARRESTRNPFAAEIERDGMILHPDPPAKQGTSNPYYVRAAGDRSSKVRSLRLPSKLWKQLEAKARRERTSVNAAMREAAQMWLRV